MALRELVILNTQTAGCESTAAAYARRPEHVAGSGATSPTEILRVLGGGGKPLASDCGGKRGYQQYGDFFESTRPVRRLAGVPARLVLLAKAAAARSRARAGAAPALSWSPATATRQLSNKEVKGALEMPGLVVESRSDHDQRVAPGARDTDHGCGYRWRGMGPRDTARRAATVADVAAEAIFRLAHEAANPPASPAVERWTSRGSRRVSLSKGCCGSTLETPLAARR